MLKQEEALILKTEPSGESFLKLHVLTAESGIFLCLKRLSKKADRSTTPDLFDQAAVMLETSQQGTMRFVKEYQLIRRRERIGYNYRCLQNASRLSRLLVSNAAHMPESEVLYELTPARSMPSPRAKPRRSFYSRASTFCSKTRAILFANLGGRPLAAI